MCRPLRIEYPYAYYHVMNRGSGRQAIFHDEAYFQAFLQTLSESHERFGLEIHAYCLMTNHFHLLVKTPEGNLQRAMRHIGGVYTQRYNRMKKTDSSRMLFMLSRRCLKLIESFAKKINAIINRFDP